MNFLKVCFEAALARVLPLQNIAAYLPKPPKSWTIVTGAVKVGGSMGQAVEALWPPGAPLEGLVVTRSHQIPLRPAGLAQRIELVESAHPVPDTAGLIAAQRMLAMVQLQVQVQVLTIWCCV